MTIRYNEYDVWQSRFKRRREDLGLTQEQLAMVTGLSTTTISDYESMKIERRDTETVTLIYNMLGLLGNPERVQAIVTVFGGDFYEAS